MNIGSYIGVPEVFALARICKVAHQTLSEWRETFNALPSNLTLRIYGPEANITASASGLSAHLTYRIHEENNFVVAEETLFVSQINDTFGKCVANLKLKVVVMAGMHNTSNLTITQAAIDNPKTSVKYPTVTFPDGSMGVIMTCRVTDCNSVAIDVTIDEAPEKK